MSIAVFDVDGVVADVRHRLQHVERRPKDWPAFFRAAADDDLLAPGAALVTDLAREHDIVWLTGRPEWLRSVTRLWLDDHGLPSDDLRMRPGGDYRPAARFKLSVLRELAARDIAAFIDDDPEVVEAALAAGVLTVLADWVPRATVLNDVQERLGRS